MLVTAIICTIRRPALIRRVLDCLDAQTHGELEVLIVGSDAAGGDIAAGAPPGLQPRLKFLAAPPGLAPARNVGLQHANGEIICFFDDDVEFGEDFLESAIRLLESPALRDVGGLTAFDVATYPRKISARWRLRSLLRITPSLAPGDSSHLGRSVTFSFFTPFSGCRTVKWLPGFCQIYRRSAIQGLFFDEHIEVEDRDFSMSVGERWRLVICGDLHISHNYDKEGRHNSVHQTWRAAFGLGRSFAKRKRSARDWFTALHVLLGELLIDVMFAAARPSLTACRIAIRRADGFIQGFFSFRSAPETGGQGRLAGCKTRFTGEAD